MFSKLVTVIFQVPDNLDKLRMEYIEKAVQCLTELLKFSFGFDSFVGVPVDNFQSLEYLFCYSKLLIINLVLDIVLDSVCGLGKDIKDFVVFIIETAIIDLELCFNIRLPSIELDFAFFVAREPIRVVKFSSVFRVEGV